VRDPPAVQQGEPRPVLLDAVEGVGRRRRRGRLGDGGEQRLVQQEGGGIWGGGEGGRRRAIPMPASSRSRLIRVSSAPAAGSHTAAQ
jgi:hypothetical protein